MNTLFRRSRCYGRAICAFPRLGWLTAPGFGEPQPGRSSFSSYSRQSQQESNPSISFDRYLKFRPGLSSKAALLKDEMALGLPGPQNLEVLQAGSFVYTVDTTSNEIFRSTINSSNRRGLSGNSLDRSSAEREPELIMRVDEFLCGAKIHALRVSRDGTSAIILILDSSGKSHVYGWESEGSRICHQEHIHGAMSIEFGTEKGSIMFTSSDETGRPSKVLKTSIIDNKHNESDLKLPEVRLLFEDRNPVNFVGVQRTKDWAHILVNSVAKTSSEAFLLDEKNGHPASSLMRRQDGVVYAVEHVGGHLVMMGNQGGRNAVYVEDKNTSSCNAGISWRLVYTPDETSFLEDMTVNKNAVTLLERSISTGLPLVRVLPLGSRTSAGDLLDISRSITVPIPEFFLDCRFGSNENFSSDVVELELLSPVIPSIKIGFNTVTGASDMASHLDSDEDALTIDNNIQNYTAIRQPFRSSSGHTIPMTLAYKNDAVNPSPVLWIVYGAYGECMDMSYAAHLLPLMNRGFKIVWCHVRGDGQLGRASYDEGRRRNKPNSILDLRECISFMAANGVSSSNAVYSYSAGAITACGALDLVDVAIMDSPFLDLIGSMSDTSHPLTCHEYDEFGNPELEEDISVMRRVCPLTNAGKVTMYPPMLLCAGDQDQQVNKSGILKYAAAVRNVAGNGSPVIVWESAYANHLPDTLDEILTVRSHQAAFILEAIDEK
jgi:protease II